MHPHIYIYKNLKHCMCLYILSYKEYTGYMEYGTPYACTCLDLEKLKACFIPVTSESNNYLINWNVPMLVMSIFVHQINLRTVCKQWSMQSYSILNKCSSSIYSHPPCGKHISQIHLGGFFKQTNGLWTLPVSYEIELDGYIHIAKGMYTVTYYICVPVHVFYHYLFEWKIFPASVGCGPTLYICSFKELS